MLALSCSHPFCGTNHRTLLAWMANSRLTVCCRSLYCFTQTIRPGLFYVPVGRVPFSKMLPAMFCLMYETVENFNSILVETNLRWQVMKTAAHSDVMSLSQERPILPFEIFPINFDLRKPPPKTQCLNSSKLA